MAVDRRIGTKVVKEMRPESAPTTRVDPYPYIGIVKNNLDPTRTGRLQVWIPDFGGNQDDPANWRTVSHASPFMGTTEAANAELNQYDHVQHTYGMWMVPPDIGVQVIVIFIAGDPLRGYWIACVNPDLSRHMMPALAGSSHINTNNLNDQEIKSQLQSGVSYPAAEFNKFNPSIFGKITSVTAQDKPVHEPQFKILREQGLDRDNTRGAISSSSQRETPSNVFGISTPGRPVKDPAGDPAIRKQVLDGTYTEQNFRLANRTRQGGHTFVMDDGSVLGDDRLIRLRTAQGHQLLMHDTKNTLYIAHADGTSWIELTNEGTINIFATAGFSVRSKGTINLHSDKDININAANNLNMKAGGKFQVDAGSIKTLSETTFNSQAGSTMEFKAAGAYNIDAGGKISIQAGGILALNGSKVTQNSGGGTTVNAIKPITVNQLSDTIKEGPTKLYVEKSGLIKTIVTIAPTHEPFNRNASSVTTVAETTAVTSAIKPTEYKSNIDATKTVQGTQVKSPATEKELRAQPPCDCTIGNLTSDQLTAYYTQIGKSESGGNYQIVNSIGFVGKYQFGYAALIDLGYVSKACTKNSQLSTNPNVWTGKDGIRSLDEFLNNPTVQEQAMCEYTKRNYNTMVRIGAITKEMPPEEAAGMMAVSHLLGAGGAKKWRNGEGGSDAYGTTGDTYFQKGKYAVTVLAPKLPTVNAG